MVTIEASPIRTRGSRWRVPAIVAGLVVFVARAHAAPTPVAIAAEPSATFGSSAGVCVRSAASSSPASDFSTSTATFESSVGGLIDANGGAGSVLAGFDLSNANPSGTMASLGDFQDAVAGCRSAGCPFAYDDTTTSYGTRIRGYLVVDQAWVGMPVHFGFFADDAVALRIFDGSGTSYAVIVRPPQLGMPTWRTTNTVTFAHAGLYPVEITYAEIAEHAALELAIHVGGFTDFESPASSSTGLATSGFTLAETGLFVRSRNPDGATAGTCVECDRADVGDQGDCDDGSYCNEAALCDPCRTDDHCGASCDPCGGATPRCADVGSGATCVACVGVADCLLGESCVAGVCRTPPPLDAGLSVDAGDADAGGPMDPELEGSGGCDCSVGGSSNSSSVLGVIAAAFVFARLRRRRMR